LAPSDPIDSADNSDCWLLLSVDGPSDQPLDGQLAQSASLDLIASRHDEVFLFDKQYGARNIEARKLVSQDLLERSFIGPKPTKPTPPETVT
jgi:hypothetical protein